MKHLLLLGMLILSPTLNMAEKAGVKQSVMVYICTGGSSKRYHNTSSCRGLNKCSGNIIKITVEKARGMGRTPCQICY